jgi:hypothetical protein
MTISQNRSKLGGIWTSDLSGSGTFKGKIAGDAVTFTLRQKGSACRAAVSGTLVQSGEIPEVTQFSAAIRLTAGPST